MGCGVKDFGVKVALSAVFSRVNTEGVLSNKKFGFPSGKRIGYLGRKRRLYDLE